ncbi:MAG: V-type ATP synthase subunit E family protein [Armatimonadota bacterium]|nr:V-type ATP synthase subunit E family protein [Armatimonadota bacterium]MDR7534250.1 V-type ATP synthase subunit E family protein [Armatimonadota bacterium]MDR7535804.1 V-type ATP synthase subunit E family protein [Armatimonadota bacterium]
MASELIALLEREAQAEREQILAEARTQAEAIVAAARQQAAELVARHRERLEAEYRAAMTKAQSTAQLRATSLVLRAKEEEIGKVFAEAEAELARLGQDAQAYPAALQTFIEEAVASLGSAAVITVHPADAPVAQAVVRRHGWQVRVTTDPAVRGGARVASADGRFVVTNTLASRLERARPMLAGEIARLLWE